MAITFQTISELQSRIANDLILSVNSGQLDATKHIDTNLRNVLVRGLVDAMAGGFDELNDTLKEVLKQLFPQTATDTYLEQWGSFFGITRKSASKAVGYIVFTGTVGVEIPFGTLIQKSDGTQFTTQTTYAITTDTISISSITRSGTTATVTTLNNHYLATGIYATISGASQTDYNITAKITVTGAKTFTYQVANSPATPATGTILLTSSTAYIDVIADDFGIIGNSENGSQLTLVSPIVNVDNTCIVPYDGLIGGLDLETDDNLRKRLQERTANFTAPFTASGLPVFIKENFPSITRVWVQTATPSAGYVTIYFVKDNDVNIIPTSTEANAVKALIIDVENGIKPANTPDNYVIVNPPTSVAINITFSSLTPNTIAMKTAISDTLYDYFRSESIAVDQDITLDEIKALIYNVVDADGNSPTFTLSAPTGTTTISSSQLAILGTITY